MLTCTFDPIFILLLRRYHVVQHKLISVVNLFVFLRFFFCFVVAICDLGHDVETIFHLSYKLTASGNLF